MRAVKSAINQGGGTDVVCKWWLFLQLISTMATTVTIQITFMWREQCLSERLLELDPDGEGRSNTAQPLLFIMPLKTYYHEFNIIIILISQFNYNKESHCSSSAPAFRQTDGAPL